MPSLKTHGLLFQQASSTYKLNDPGSTELGIRAFLTYVNGEILKIGGPITLSIPNTPIFHENVYGFNAVYDKRVTDVDLMTRPRADVAMVAMVSGKLQEVCYLSIDCVTSPSDIPYYSGLNTRADANKPGNISKDPSVVSFLRAVVARLNDVVVSRKSLFVPVKDRKLIGRAAFGALYKRENKNSKDNVHGRGQGKIFRLSPFGSGYALRFSNGFRLNDRDLRVYETDSKHRVVLSAEPLRSARFKVDGKEYKGVRVLLKPQAAVDPQAEQLPPSK